MKWKAKYLTNDPESGTVRVRRKFAWTPTQIEGDIVFLAHYDILEAFIVNAYRVRIDGHPKELTAGAWIPIEKRLIARK